MFSRTMLSIPSLIFLLAAYSSAETTSAEPNPYTYVCANIDGKDKLMGSLNPERKFVRDDQKTSKVEPSGDCQCTINIPSLLTCQEPITNSPLPAKGDVFCSKTDQCAR
ncbi:hypothetical protein MJO28_008050 [Puccinia striiformis f. sp. tritici]|uniref:Uncharacterized protein n=2 Tax=Puccinia striiformis TaxID=27350 RepID=A0ACC0EAA9_9BASI|nr:hypothetical protein Pst134EB_016964 [Puccinia striiformis f. sp. tritici]KAI7949229.1 hypothetical protein MJO28_008050 [Puccinia striiformis f. sp. tritici]